MVEWWNTGLKGLCVVGGVAFTDDEAVVPSAVMTLYLQAFNETDQTVLQFECESIRQVKVGLRKLPSIEVHE